MISTNVDVVHTDVHSNAGTHNDVHPSKQQPSTASTDTTVATEHTDHATSTQQPTEHSHAGTATETQQLQGSPAGRNQLVSAFEAMAKAGYDNMDAVKHWTNKQWIEVMYHQEHYVQAQKRRKFRVGGDARNFFFLEK